MLARAMALFLSVYIPFWVPSGAVVSAGATSGNPATNAFDGSQSMFFASAQTGADVNGVSYIGVFYDSNWNVVTGPFYVVVDQCQAGYEVSSVLFQVDSGLGWGGSTAYSVGSGLTAFTTTTTGQYRGIRLLANSEVAGTNRWRVCEVGLYMVQPNPSGLIDTSTPTNTLTPSITPTASNTPTPTPDFYEVITSTQGADMGVSRTATFGEILIFAGLMAVFAILAIRFAWDFWTRRNA